MKNNYLDIDKTCEMINMSKSTVYSYVGKNKIPYIKLGGKLLFSEDDLNAWLNSMKQPVINSGKK
jgi:excisionase family DNA binding protein